MTDEWEDWGQEIVDNFEAAYQAGRRLGRLIEMAIQANDERLREGLDFLLDEDYFDEARKG